MKHPPNHTFELSTGRSLDITSLHQWAVYAGLLEGLPTRRFNEGRIERLVIEARNRDGHEPFVITPEQQPIDYPGRYPFGEPAALPAIACTAAFYSHSPARDRDKHRSALTVIWFQDDYAFPLSEQAERALRDLDWEALARDIGFYP